MDYLPCGCTHPDYPGSPRLCDDCASESPYSDPPHDYYEDGSPSYELWLIHKRKKKNANSVFMDMLCTHEDRLRPMLTVFDLANLCSSFWEMSKTDIFELHVAREVGKKCLGDMKKKEQEMDDLRSEVVHIERNNFYRHESLLRERFGAQIQRLEESNAALRAAGRMYSKKHKDEVLLLEDKVKELEDKLSEFGFRVSKKAKREIIVVE